jgi:hypothetical protein
VDIRDTRNVFPSYLANEKLTNLTDSGDPIYAKASQRQTVN